MEKIKNKAERNQALILTFDIIDEKINTNMSIKNKIKDIDLVDQPREKLIKYGPEKLSNSELLAILLRTGKKGENVVEMSQKILQKFNSKNLAFTKFDELKRYNGLGPAKACEIVACFELGKRLLKDKKTNLFLSPEEIFNELKDVRNHKKEHFVIFYLDSRNQEIKREVISVGTLNASLVHPREVFEPAIRHNCAQLIVAHNHPSGNSEPSQDDIEITKRLANAGKILGIELLDHIIVARDSFISLKQKNII